MGAQVQEAVQKHLVAERPAPRFPGRVKDKRPLPLRFRGQEAEQGLFTHLRLASYCFHIRNRIP